MKNLRLFFILSVICFLTPISALGQRALAPIRIVTKSSIKNLPPATIRTISSTALHHITIPNFPALEATTLQKQLLRASNYRREITQADIASFRLQEVGPKNSLTNFVAQNPQWADFIVNNSLNRYVQAAVKAEDYEAVRKELTEYYGLRGSGNHSFIDLPADLFVSSAIGYMVRHPHKINLRLREVLKSSMIDAELKANITSFIGKDRLSLEDQQQLEKLLKSAYDQYRTNLFNATQEPEIQQIYQTYTEVVAALTHFTAQMGRFPRIVGNPDEHTLAVKVDLLLKQSHLYQFEPIRSEIKHLQLLRELYPVEILPFDLFVEKFRAYVKETNRTTPVYPTMENFASPEDNILYDSYEYYQKQDPEKFYQAIIPIIRPLFPPGTRL